VARRYLAMLADGAEPATRTNAPDGRSDDPDSWHVVEALDRALKALDEAPRPTAAAARSEASEPGPSASG
jgi:hypothetical protein